MVVERSNVGERRIQVGIVGAPHGIRGELRIKSFMQAPASIGDHALFTSAAGGQAVRIVAVRGLKDDMVVGRLAGIADREAAARLTGQPLFIDRAALAPAEEDEFYHADLVGLRVQTTAGLPVGTVGAVVNYGGGDLLDIAVETGGTLLVPFLKRFVPEVDLAAGVLAVTAEALQPGGEDEPEASDLS